MKRCYNSIVKNYRNPVWNTVSTLAQTRKCIGRLLLMTRKRRCATIISCKTGWSPNSYWNAEGPLKKGPFLLYEFGEAGYPILIFNRIILPIWSGKPILVCRFFCCPKARPIGHGRLDSPSRQNVTQWKEVRQCLSFLREKGGFGHSFLTR